MGKTYRKGDGQKSYFDDDRPKQKSKHPNHASGRKTHGMKIVNRVYEDDEDDYFDDEVQVTDEITLNTKREDS